MNVAYLLAAGLFAGCSIILLRIILIRSLYKEFVMRALLSIAVLMSAAASAIAGPVITVPEPESLALLGIAAVAMLVVRRIKK
jgi:uncharacterized membrane protein YjjP (DUF1212 family)